MAAFRASDAGSQMPSAIAGPLSVLDPQGRVLSSEVLASDPATNTYRLLVDVKNVPSMGYTILHVVPGARPVSTDLKVSGLTIENANLRITVDPKTGCITSLFDKRSNFESLAGNACGNQLQTFRDTPKDYDAWNIDPGTFDHMTPIDTVDSVELSEKGPLRRCDSRIARLAKLEVCPGHHFVCRSRSSRCSKRHRLA